MQYIEDLTMIHKAAIGATLVMIMLLLVVSARRRRTAAAAPAAAIVDGPASRKASKRARSKAPGLPRRKRRKLAAEAAHSMGVDPTPPAPQVPEVPTARTPEAPVVSMPEAPSDPILEDLPDADPFVAPVPAAPAIAPEPDDPYLHERQEATGPFVAQPGWPTPGELASSFDPDAFDPLPEAYGPLPDDESRDQSDQLGEADDTSAIEMPAFSTAAEVAALEEIEEWTDTLETDDDWSLNADEVPAKSGWNFAHDEAPVEAAAAPDGPAIDLEGIWSEPDDEPRWSAAEPNETDTADAPSIDLPVVAVMDEHRAFDVPDTAWADDSQDAWQIEADEQPAEALEMPALDTTTSLLETPAPAAWNGSIGGQNSPVVLDLAGLAASGQSLELVIEPTADGTGVRLRFGAPNAGSVDAMPALGDADLDGAIAASPPDTNAVVVIGEAAAPAVTEVDQPSEPVLDMAFLAGVAPVPPASVVAPDVVESAVVAEAVAPVIVEVAPAVDQWLIAGPETSIDASGTGAHEGAPANVEQTPTAESERPANVEADTDTDDDDPARILADIRARLAALDSRR